LMVNWFTCTQRPGEQARNRQLSISPRVLKLCYGAKLMVSWFTHAERKGKQAGTCS
jgi:hypothetical protein